MKHRAMMKCQDSLRNIATKAALFIGGFCCVMSFHIPSLDNEIRANQLFILVTLRLLSLLDKKNQFNSS